MASFLFRLLAEDLLVTGLPNPVGISIPFVGFIIFIFLRFFFSMSVKVLPVTPLLSGVCVHRAFCTHREGSGKCEDFSGGHSGMINLTGNGIESHGTQMAF